MPDNCVPKTSGSRSHSLDKFLYPKYIYEMGQVRSMLSRPMRTFNIENRTAKLLDREKPVPAPHYPATEKQVQLTEQMYPDIKEKLSIKDEHLDERLKSVFVVSKEEQRDIDGKAMSEVLKEKEIAARCHDPTSRFEPYDPVEIPVGKCTILNVMEFLGKYQDDREVYTAEKIALDFKLDKEDVSNILKYYSIFVARRPNFSVGIAELIDEDEGEKKEIEREKEKAKED